MLGILGFSKNNYLFFNSLSLWEVAALPKKHEVIINRAWCKGCGLCINICPKKVLGFNEQRKAQVERIEDCIGCRQCENTCPDFAVTVKEGKEDA